MKSSVSLTFVVMALTSEFIYPGTGNAWSLLESVGLAETKDFVEVSALYEKRRCPDVDYPVVMEITNNYDQPITGIVFEVWGRPEYQSEFTYASRHDRSNRIIESGETLSLCIAILALFPGASLSGMFPLQDMIWTAEISDVSIWN